MFRNLNISTRLTLLLLLSLTITAVLPVSRSEVVLEDAILSQTKQQVRIFLLGIEREINLQGNPLDPELVERIMTEAKNHQTNKLGFSIRQLYSYDRSGNVYATIGDEKKGRVS